MYSVQARKDAEAERTRAQAEKTARKGLQEQLAAARGMSGPKQCNT